MSPRTGRELNITATNPSGGKMLKRICRPNDVIFDLPPAKSTRSYCRLKCYSIPVETESQSQPNIRKSAIQAEFVIRDNPYQPMESQKIVASNTLKAAEQVVAVKSENSTPKLESSSNSNLIQNFLAEFEQCFEKLKAAHQQFSKQLLNKCDNFQASEPVPNLEMELPQDLLDLDLENFHIDMDIPDMMSLYDVKAENNFANI